MWNLIECTELFNQVHDEHDQYDAKSHLAEIIALLGPPPERLLARENAMAQRNWPDKISNEAGFPSRNAREYFGGPFLSREGWWLP